MVNARQKGKRGELDACHTLKDIIGGSPRRGQQYRGSPDSPDIVEAIAGVHIEVKRRQTSSIYKWMAQAQTDARPSEVPCVMWRKDGEKWLVVIPAQQLLDFAQRVVAQYEENTRQ